MKAERKLSVKVKSKTERRIMEEPNVEMITEWNIKRILVALFILLLLVILPAYYLSQSDNNDLVDTGSNSPLIDDTGNKQQGTVIESEAKQRAKSNFSDTIFVKKASPQDNDGQKAGNSKQKLVITPSYTNAQTTSVQATQQKYQQNLPEKLFVATGSKAPSVNKSITNDKLLNAYISRAQLAKGVNNKEPFGEVSLPLLVDDNKAQGISYFTEVINKKGSTIFHEWLKQGETVFKRKVIIRGNRWRINTSKLFTQASIGQWQVRIVTDQGDVLHEIDFSVEKR